MKRFNISLPDDLVISLDAASKKEYTSRSAYIREAIEMRIKLDDYVENEINNKESYLNIIKAVHFRRMTSRNINQYKPKVRS